VSDFGVFGLVAEWGGGCWLLAWGYDWKWWWTSGCLCAVRRAVETEWDDERGTDPVAVCVVWGVKPA